MSGRAGSRARFVGRTLLDSFLTLSGVAVLVFFLLRVIPGDEITARYGIEAGALTDTQRAAVEAYYGLDQSLPQQFTGWVGSVLSGNFGISVTSGRPVSEQLLRTLPVTIELALLAIIFAVVIGVAVGVFAASRPDSWRDTTGQTFGLLGLGIPNFVLASTIIAVLSSAFGYFPSAASYVNIWEDPFVNLQQQIYPALALGMLVAATVMRTTRSAFLESADQNFVRTARGKGLSESRITIRHILHNSLIPIVTISGIQFGYLLGGTVIIEQIFALPGLGRLVLNGISQREYAVVQSGVLVIATMFVGVNLLVDLLYSRIDPRVGRS